MIYIMIPVLIILLPPIFLFLYLTITEYKPEEIEDTIRYRKTKDNTHYASYNIVTYNIGYCTHDKVTKKQNESSQYSFKIESEVVYDNLIAMTNIIKDTDCEFTLIQEADLASSRSGKVDQVEFISSELNDMNSSFAYNYNAKYIPFPLTHPVGGTYSGLLTLSKYPALSSKRHSLDGHETYPRSLFYLKRCMLVEEYLLPNKKKLIIINVHLASYDKNNLFRTEQIHHVLRYINKIYNRKENAVIVGGDFNFLMNPEELKVDTPDWLERLPEEVYSSEFTPVYPKTGHTVKSGDLQFNIDGYLVSKNVRVLQCDIIDDDFTHSNHNPVKMTFQIKK